MPAPIGYEDTPILPNTTWRVHDPNRPQPAVVTPAPFIPGSATAHPPSDATVLFDGSDFSGWVGRGDVEVGWRLVGGAMEATRTGDIKSRAHFGDCQLHLEWCSPQEARGDSQGRGNSGVFLMGQYEIQVLDSYDNRTYADGHAGAIYGQHPPFVNASRKPGEWQTYDLIFIAPRFEGEKVIRPAYITLIHNGILVHHHRELLGKTGHKTMPSYVPHPPKGPIILQDHGDPVRYRNIWVREIAGGEAF